MTKQRENAAELVAELNKRRGRPPSGKILVTLRLDPAVVAAFKATGPGWQARVNDALREVRPQASFSESKSAPNSSSS